MEFRRRSTTHLKEAIFLSIEGQGIMTKYPNEHNPTKVPELTAIFWVIKVAATTFGETAGDAVSISMNLGYLMGTFFFSALFLLTLFLQLNAERFYSGIYWMTIIATTTVGTTLADFADRSLGIGYSGGSTLLFFLLLASLAAWHRTLGSISITTSKNSKAEFFYWTTIMLSQTLGTALGDWTADTMELGYLGAAMIFGSFLLIVVGLYFWTKISRVFLFWNAFILTRPLGAVIGDYLDKPLDHGGLALSRYTASIVLLVFISLCILITPQRAAANSH